MGILMEMLKKKSKIFVVIDWILMIALIISFLYFSLAVRSSINECKEWCESKYCPSLLRNVSVVVR